MKNSSRVILPILILLFNFLQLAHCQSSALFPILGSPNKILDAEGKVVFELPEDYKLVNGADGHHDPGWNQRVPGLDVGQCGYYLAIHDQYDSYVLLDANQNILRNFGREYQSIAPCREGFHLATKKVNQKYYEEKRYFFLDAVGNPVFAATGYSKASKFNEGLAAVKVDNKGWRYINDLGHELKLIPDSLNGVEHVSAFKDGLSMVVYSGKNVGQTNTKLVYYIDRDGRVVLDLSLIFPGKNIISASEFEGGIASVEFYKKPGLAYSGNDMAFFDVSGRVVVAFDDLSPIQMHQGAYISFTRCVKPPVYKPYLFTREGRSIALPDSSSNISYISEHYFQISTHLGTGRAKHYIFDADREAICFEIYGTTCMGIRGRLAAFKDANNRHYVIHLDTKEIFYDTRTKDLTVRNLDYFQGDVSEIEKFICSDDKVVNRISEMKNLRELTLQNLKLEYMPHFLKPEALRLLRIDGCRKLTSVNTSINRLRHLALRDCTALTNLATFIDAQIGLENLFVINMDMAAGDKDRFEKKYPWATLMGSSKDADLEIQMEIPDF